MYIILLKILCLIDLNNYCFADCMRRLFVHVNCTVYVYVCVFLVRYVKYHYLAAVPVNSYYYSGYVHDVYVHGVYVHCITMCILPPYHSLYIQGALDTTEVHIVPISPLLVVCGCAFFFKSACLAFFFLNNAEEVDHNFSFICTSMML